MAEVFPLFSELISRRCDYYFSFCNFYLFLLIHKLLDVSDKILVSSHMISALSSPFKEQRI